MSDVIAGLEGSITIDRKTQTAKLTIQAKGKRRGKALHAFLVAHGKPEVKSVMSITVRHRGFTIESAKMVIELSVLPDALMGAQGIEDSETRLLL